VRRIEEQWGTAITLEAPDDIDEAVLDACFAWFQRVDDLFSTWRDDTEIMRIARGDLGVDTASAEVREVLDLCEQMRLESNGAFDIRVGALPGAPSRPGRAPLDPSGLVKGWAVQRAADLAVADAYATAAVAFGPDEGMHWMAGRVGYDAMGITRNGTVLLTPGFDRYRVS